MSINIGNREARRPQTRRIHSDDDDGLPRR